LIKKISAFLLFLTIISSPLSSFDLIPAKGLILSPGKWATDYAINYQTSIRGYSNQETIEPQGTIRYGLLSDIEVGLAGVFQASRNRLLVDQSLQQSSSQIFKEAQAYIKLLFRSEDSLPGLLGTLKTSLWETSELSQDNKTWYKPFHFKTWQFEITIIKTEDPLVFTMTSGLLIQEERMVHQTPIDAGNLFFIQPVFHFLINDAASLSWGILFASSEAPKINGVLIDIPRNTVTWQFGSSYSISRFWAINFTFYADVSGTGSNSMVGRMSYEL